MLGKFPFLTRLRSYHDLSGTLRGAPSTDRPQFCDCSLRFGKKQERETKYLNLFIYIYIYRVSLRIVRTQTALKRMQQLFFVFQEIQQHCITFINELIFQSGILLYSIVFKKNRLETMDRFLTISIGKAPVRTYASHARASHLSCQTNVSSPLPFLKCTC